MKEKNFIEANLLLVAALAFAAGIGIGTVAEASRAGALWIILIACAIALYVCLSVPAGLAVRRNFFTGSLMLFAFGAGLLRISLDPGPSHSLDDKLGASIAAEAIVIGEPDDRGSYVQAKVEFIDALGARAVVRMPRYPVIAYGDKVRIEGTLELPEEFETDAGRSFDYAGYLAKDGVGYVIDFAAVERLEGGHGNTLKRWLLAVKAVFVSAIRKALPEPHSSLLVGMLVGGRNALGDRLSDEFRIAGLSHVIVLSGYNIAIVAGAIMALLSFLPRRMSAFGAAGGIVLFALMAGAEPSVMRATAMALLAILARAAGRRYEPLRALVLAGVGMIAATPLILVHDPSFQLSFLATVGLIVGTPIMERILRFVPTHFGLRELFATTIATQSFVLPFLLYMTGMLGILSLPANILVLPVIPAAMLLGFIAALAAFIPGPLALFVALPARAALAYVFDIVHIVASLPFSSLSIPAFPAWVLALWYGTYAFMFYRYAPRLKAASSTSPDKTAISDEAMEYEFIS